MNRKGIGKEDAMKVLRWFLCAMGIMVMGEEVCAADQVIVEVAVSRRANRTL